jgi:hypothetical protein
MTVHSRKEYQKNYGKAWRERNPDYNRDYYARNREEALEAAAERRKTHVYMLMAGGKQCWITPAQAKILEPLRPEYRFLEAIKPSALRRVEADMAEEAKRRENETL